LSASDNQNPKALTQFTFSTSAYSKALSVYPKVSSPYSEVLSTISASTFFYPVTDSDYSGSILVRSNPSDGINFLFPLPKITETTALC
jgi:hypothetical protein